MAVADRFRVGGITKFPVGIAAELDADAHTVRLLDPPLIPASPADAAGVDEPTVQLRRA